MGIIPLTETCSFQSRLISRVGEVGNPNALAVQMRQSRTPRHVIPPTRRSLTGPLAQILMKIGGKPALPDGPGHGTFRSFSQRSPIESALRQVRNARPERRRCLASCLRPLPSLAPLPSRDGSDCLESRSGALAGTSQAYDFTGTSKGIWDDSRAVGQASRPHVVRRRALERDVPDFRPQLQPLPAHRLQIHVCSARFPCSVRSPSGGCRTT